MGAWPSVRSEKEHSCQSALQARGALRDTLARSLPLQRRKWKSRERNDKPPSQGEPTPDPNLLAPYACSSLRGTEKKMKTPGKNISKEMN